MYPKSKLQQFKISHLVIYFLQNCNSLETVTSFVHQITLLMNL